MRLPGDPEIRSALKLHLLDAWVGCAQTRIIEEFGLCRGKVRVDMAAVNGALHGYEIKSARDCLGRLATQVDICAQVLDRATVVESPEHLETALDLVRP